MKQLRISPEVALPVDVAGEAIAILAKRGAGKTNTATVLVEELVGAGVQVVVLDPVGAWWGIRSGESGDARGGLGVPVLGGQHGDVPLEQTAGALVADVAVDSGQSLLVDLSDFPSKGAVNRFVTDFAERLYRRKARESSLLHLVLEEADEFAPQSKSADTARMRGAIEAIVRRGRSRGLGVTLITQRSAVLNKDVLTQTDVLIVMRTTGPQDVDAIKKWISAHADEGAEQVLASLPSLETGEAWIWNPERGLLDRVRIRRRRTFDSSKTPGQAKRAEPKARAAINLDRLGEQIQATAEKAKQNDPAELRRQVPRERGERREEARPPSPEPAARPPARRPAPAAADGEFRISSSQQKILDSLAWFESIDRPAPTRVAVALVAGVSSTSSGYEKNLSTLRTNGLIGYPFGGALDLTPDGRALAVPPTSPPSEDELREAIYRRVSRPQAAILRELVAVAWDGAPFTREALAEAVQVSATSSGFEKNLSTLRTLGLVEYPERGYVMASSALFLDEA